jgi:DNA-directed RNA polymerase subunit beta'
MPQYTYGQLALARILPEDVYTPGQQIDKSSIKDILAQVAERYPDRYKEISHNLLKLGRDVGVSFGGASFGIDNLATPLQAAKRRQEIRKKIQAVYEKNSPNRNDEVNSILDSYLATDADETAAEAEKEENPLVFQLKGAGRGSPSALARIISSDLRYNDPQGRPVPIPVLNSYSHGLTPGEYAASTYGARLGLQETKLGVADAGFMAKTLNAAAHRMAVMDVDAPDELRDLSMVKGLPVPVDDKDSVGSLLAADFGPYARNTVITPKILSDLNKKGYDEILVRSPITTVEPTGGVYARDIGIREKNRLPEVGSVPGLLASAALSEPLTQMKLSSKHSGGAGKSSRGLSGFALVEKLVNPPKEFVEAAALSEIDGKVTAIKPAPQGGNYVYVGTEEHYVLPDVPINVKIGDEVEAGDQLSDGPINPRDIVRHKGIGEGARVLTEQLVKSLKKGGAPVHRRNAEAVMRGLLDRVQLTSEFNEYVPDDFVPYSYIESNWKPRAGHEVSDVKYATGKYMEIPALHYTIGTRVTPKVASKLEKFGVKKIAVHNDPPPFAAGVGRAVDLMHSDPDWMSRYIGTSLDKSLLTSVHRAGTSDTQGSSFVPARAEALDFGVKGTFSLGE